MDDKRRTPSDGKRWVYDGYNYTKIFPASKLRFYYDNILFVKQ
jgi:hypothetical protein